LIGTSLIRLSGKSEHDVDIQFTGLRDGEKLDEELFYEHEKVTPTSCDRIKRKWDAEGLGEFKRSWDEFALH